MSYRVDSKGKIFTDVVRKEHFQAHIQTIMHTIRGEVYVRPGLRFKDELNGTAEQFIAVTDAEVYDGAGALIARSPFLTVNKDHIIWVQPREDAESHDNEIAAPPE